MKFINWLKVWFKAARAPFLIVSIVPGTLAGIMALKAGMWNCLYFALALVGAVLAHSAGDFFDDYYDFKSNTLGHKEQQFHDSPIIHGQVTANQVLGAGIGCAAIALGIGAFFLFKVGMPIVYIAAATGLIAVFYTAPPIKLNFRGFGETGLFFAFGPLLTLGVWTAVTGQLSLVAALIGIPIGLLTMNIGHISNTFDVPSDIAQNKTTIAVRLGQKNSVVLLAVTSGLAYVAIGVCVYLGLFPIWSLITLLTIPLAISVVVSTNKYGLPGNNYTSAMGQAIALTTVLSLLFIVAYLL